jgi:Zn-dependent M28 family amino/carboxypeptidase
MLAQVRSTQLYTDVGALSGLWPITVGGQPYTLYTRHTDSGAPIAKATQFIYERLQDLGLSPQYEEWQSRVDEKEYTGRNVTALLRGVTHPDEVVLLSAHLDNKIIADGVLTTTAIPGADDNASGTAGVLMAARILSQYRFARSVRLMIFTGEEVGLLGSSAAARHARQRGEHIVAILNLDMIGFDSDNNHALELHARHADDPGYADELRIAQTFTQVVAAYGLSSGLAPLLLSDDMGRSDHWPFREAGYPALLAIEDYTHDHSALHTPRDTLSALNLPYYTRFVQAVVGTIAHLAEPLAERPPFFNDLWWWNRIGGDPRRR